LLKRSIIAVETFGGRPRLLPTTWLRPCCKLRASPDSL